MKKILNLKLLALLLFFGAAAMRLQAQTTESAKGIADNQPAMVNAAPSGGGGGGCIGCEYLPPNAASPLDIRAVKLTTTHAGVVDLALSYAAVSSSPSVYLRCGTNPVSACNVDQTSRIPVRDTAGYSYYKLNSSYALNYPLYKISNISIPTIQTGYSGIMQSTFCCGSTGSGYLLTSVSYKFDADNFVIKVVRNSDGAVIAKSSSSTAPAITLNAADLYGEKSITLEILRSDYVVCSTVISGTYETAGLQSQTEIKGSKPVGTQTITAGKTQLINCDVDKLQFNFSGVPAVNAYSKITIGGREFTGAAISYVPGNPKAVEVALPSDFYFFPTGNTAVSLQLANVTASYTITKPTDFDQKESAFLSEPPHDYQSYSYCDRRKITINKNGWDKVLLGSNETEQPFYLTYVGRNSYNAREYFGKCQRTQTLSVDVASNAVALQLNVNTPSVCQGDSVRLELKALSGSTPASCIWKYRVKGASTWTTIGSGGVKFAHKNTTAGEYEYRAEAGTCESEYLTSSVVTVKPTTVLTISSAINNAACSGGNFTLTANVAGTNPTDYKWYTQGGSQPVGTGTAFTQNNATTDYTYELRTTGGCSANIPTYFVKVYQMPAAPTFEDKEYFTCDGGEAQVRFTNLQSTANYHLYKTGQSETYAYFDGQAAPKDLNLSAGEYVLTAKLSNYPTCSSSSKKVSIINYASPAAFEFKNDLDNGVCEIDEEVDLFSFIKNGKSAVNANKYTWGVFNIRNGVPSTLNNSDFTTLPHANYVVYLTLDNGHCITGKDKVITILETPKKIELAGDDAYCNGSLTNISTIEEQEGVSYQWYLNGKPEGEKTEVSTFEKSFGTSLDTIFVVGNIGACTRKSNVMYIENVTINSDLAFTVDTIKFCRNKGLEDITESLNGAVSKDAIEQTKIANGDLKYNFISSHNDLFIDKGHYIDKYASKGCHDLTVEIKQSFKTQPKERYCSIYKDSVSVLVYAVPDTFHIYATDPSFNGEPLCNTKIFSLSSTSKIPVIWYDATTSLNKFGTELIDSTTQEVRHYNAIVLGEAGCTRESENSITVVRKFVPLDIKFEADSIYYCRDNEATVSLFGKMNGANKDLIKNGNGYTITFERNENLPMLDNGDINIAEVTGREPYAVIFTASKDGCSTKTKTNLFVETIPGIATITADNYLTCANSDVILTASAENATSYIWFRDSELEDTTKSNNKTVTIINEYTEYSVQGFNKGCKNGIISDNISIETVPLPDAFATISRGKTPNGLIDISFKDFEYADSLFLILLNSTGNIVGNYAYNVQDDEEVKPQLPSNLNSAEKYSLKVILTSSEGCTDFRHIFNIDKAGTKILPVSNTYLSSIENPTQFVKTKKDNIYYAFEEKDEYIEEEQALTPETIQQSDLYHFNYQLYPNPAKDKLTINLGQEAEFVQIMNMFGQMVIKENLTNTMSKEIDVSNLKQGTYFVGVFDGSKMVTKKLVIIK